MGCDGSDEDGPDRHDKYPSKPESLRCETETDCPQDVAEIKSSRQERYAPPTPVLRETKKQERVKDRHQDTTGWPRRPD